MVKKMSKEKIHNIKKFEEHQGNLMLIATLITAVSLFALMWVNRSLNIISDSFATTRLTIIGIAIALAVAAVVFFVLSYLKSKTFIEYGVFCILMAICYWGIYGMPFTTANHTAILSSLHARYLAVAVSVIYLVVSLIIHSVAIKNGKKAIIKK